MPNVPTLVAGGFPSGFPSFPNFPSLPGGFDVGDLGSIISDVTGIIQQFTRPRPERPPTIADIARPIFPQPGVPIPMANVPTTVSFPGGAGFDLPFVDIVPQGATCISPRTSTSVRLPSRVDVPTVDAQGATRFTTYRNMGRPILWSGDAACAKRFAKVTGRTLARRRSGGR